MINSIKIENLRSIKDSGYINIAPLNILLGMNSSGKSTFLRSFPLLSQSISRSLRGPVSWFDVTSVDFGDYQTAKSRYASEDETIRFSFNLSLEDIPNYLRYMHNYRYRYRYLSNFSYLTNLIRERNKKIEVTISLNDDPKGTYINKLTISLTDFVFTMNVDSRAANVVIKIDGKVNMLDYGVKKKWNFATSHGIMPSFENKEEDFQTEILDRAVMILSNLCNKRLKHSDRVKSIFNVFDNSKEALLNSIKQSDIISLKKCTANWDIYDTTFQEVYYLWITSQLPLLLGVIDNSLNDFYQNCSYIAPTRAEASRFYRNQGLQVTDVDAYGRNLQEFISSLTDKQRTSYSMFTKEILGVSVGVSNNTGHQSIFLENVNGKFNLADVGFGYSQVLPIITKLWYITQKAKRYEENTTKRIVVIEQPELHLHPAMQAKVADAFINTIKTGRENDIDIRFIIETHSQTFINRIGRRIREKGIHINDVNLILFEKDREERNSSITQTKFKENGQIKNWPYGFFDPIDN